MMDFLRRVGYKLTSTKSVAFALVLAVLAFVTLPPTNAEVLTVLVVSLFGANAAQHWAAAFAARNKE
jgi:hypothetical protein